MPFFLDALEPYREKSLQLFLEGARPFILFFSRSVYHFFFTDSALSQQQDSENSSGEGVWVFLECADGSGGEITNFFCSCRAEDKLSSFSGSYVQEEGCIHVALASISLFSAASNKETAQKEAYNTAIPLHKRFYHHSVLHNFLYTAFREKQERLQLKVETDHLVSLQLKGKPFCQIATTKKEVMDTFFSLYKQAEEADENSIQFFSASEEERQLWEAGEKFSCFTANSSLSYELSSFASIAKFFFLYSEGIFSSSSKALLPHISSQFDVEKREVHLIFSLADVCEISFFSIPYPLLPSLFCTLVQIPFSVSANMAIDIAQKRDYSINLAQGKIAIESTYVKKSSKISNSIYIDQDWIYQKDSSTILFQGDKDLILEGLDSIEESLWALESIRAIDAKEVEIIQSITVLADSKAISTLSQLQIEGELVRISEKDLVIGDWIFLSREKRKKNLPKFVKVIGIKRFDIMPQLIVQDEVDAFLMKHIVWLSTQKEFRLHFHQYNKKSTYQIDKKNRSLLFRSQIEKSSLDRQIESKKKGCIFGRWVWVKEEGFFLSDEEPIQPRFSSFPFNIPIPPHRVSHFIEKRKEEIVELIPSFFSSIIPVQVAGLSIEYHSNTKRVEVSTKYKWTEEKYEKEAYLYDSYGYIPKLGFFQIPIPDINGLSVEAKNKEQWDHFFLQQLPNIIDQYECEIDPRIKSVTDLKLYCDTIETDLAVLTEEEEEKLYTAPRWRSDFFWKSVYGTISFEEICRALQEISVHSDKAIRFLPTKAGLIDLTDTRFLWVRPFIERKNVGKRKNYKSEDTQKESRSTSLELGPSDFIRIQAYDTLFFTNERSIYERTIQQLLNSKAASEPILSFFSGTLRPYQKIGLSWLWFLYSFSLSGLLCDDMGVGKTHQAMALIAAVYAEKREKKRAAPIARFLIVCPSSLIYHWKEKLELFLPQLTYYMHLGSMRSCKPAEQEWNILITTYGTIRRDVQLLREIAFDVAVFDELQIAKNHMSLIWNSLSKLSARMRLGLSGTPIENRLRELKSLFDLILPGYLPSDLLFKELYVKLDDESSLETRRALLGKSISPFILRRSKEQVLPELPSKIEEAMRVDLIGDQKRLYQEISYLEGAPLIKRLEDRSESVPYMHIFSLLSALKQISNHPACYFKDPTQYKKFESGKWLLFQELIEEAIGSGQKVVVFSQYLTMLDIMALYCQEKGIEYAQIRGSTKERGAEITRFQSDPACTLFLGSLQTSGLGIDLTSASIVIHYDRWWNAARENQATDRVHRSGQRQSIRVIKLITRDTVDEKIDRMISQKASLLKEVVSYDDHNIAKKFSRDELIELLRHTPHI